MKISEYFNLNRKQNELDFVDIDFDNDMPLFIDPYFLSTRTDRWSRSANSTLESFFQYILGQFEVGNIAEVKRNFKFTEPTETCLGLSKTGTKGKSIGENDATKLFQYILDSKVLEDGLISSVNEIKIFVDNISHDKISDLCTNVIRKHLIEYTKTQCNLYNIKLTSGIATKEYWDAENLEWKVSYEEMLIINEKPILLVPKFIVCRKKGFYYDSEHYARHFVLHFLVSEEIRMNSNLVKRKELKNGEIKVSVVKQEVADKYGAYSKSFLRTFTKRHPVYFEHFKKTAESNLNPLSNEEIIEDHTNEFYLNIIERLIQEFENIIPGRTDADKFHEHIIACMNFLFYPNLINPVKERAINQGRKRIDLVYENAASEGYFHRLHSIKQIPCSFILIECKNYTKDIANPELDQLNGRFSPNRGKVGFMIFRGCKDEKQLLKRCADYYADNQNLIIPLQDRDFIFALNELKKDLLHRASKPQEDLLNEITRDIILA